MVDVLIIALARPCHVDPLLAVAEDLVCRGDRVTVMSGAAYGGAIVEAGAHPHPLPADAAVDFRLLSTKRYDAVIVDCEMPGVVPLLLERRAQLPAVLCYAARPLTLSAHSATPGTAPPPVSAESLLVAETLADRLIVPSVPSFVRPRSNLPACTRFVGLVRPRRPARFSLPPWWPELDAGRPVVHISQESGDPPASSRLVESAITALADEDVTMVVSTGGRGASSLRVPLPANTYVCEHLPHDRLLPKVTVVVTDGGYGTVQHALAAGVPLVVAGGTGDSAAVAARVASAGAGIDLGTSTPSAATLRSAVRCVCHDGRYLQQARNLEAAFAQRDGVAEIASLVDEAVHERAGGRAATTGSGAPPVARQPYAEDC